MAATTTPGSAMLPAASAMLAQSYPVGPGWAAYRLPFPSTVSAREVGVCFEGEPAGGATPPAATPPATPPAAPSATPPATPATGEPAEPEALGEAGKKALREERAAKKAAEDALATAQAELETLRTSTLSDQEKAIKEAGNTAAAAERAKWQASIRSVRVESALRVAGATNEKLLDLALRSDLIANLKVDEAGKVTDLDKAVAQLKTDIPEMFSEPTPGAPTRGAQPGSPAEAKDLESAVAGYYTKH